MKTSLARNSAKVFMAKGELRPMSDVEKVAFQRKLNELSDRLHARKEQLRKAGRFSDVHEVLLKRIQRHSDSLRKRVSETERGDSAWELIKAELVRDYSSLFDDLLAFEETLDVEFKKGNEGPKREASH